MQLSLVALRSFQSRLQLLGPVFGRGGYRPLVVLALGLSVKYVFCPLFMENVKDWLRGCFRKTLTWCVDFFRIPPRTRMHHFRSIFRSTQTPTISSGSKTHTHPVSASWRSSTMVLANLLARKLGLVPYAYQGSSADQRDKFDGSRQHFWAKDVMAVGRCDYIRPDHLIVITDVDYYVDVPKLLLALDQPVLLYTFQPTVAACGKGEYSFAFNSDNEVEYNVSGGARYKHRVWNYSQDVVTVSDAWKTKSFIVERRQANEHHEYVLLIPIGSWRFIGAWFANWLSGDQLSRLDVHRDGFTVLDVQNKEGVKRSIARSGTFNAATLDVGLFDAVASVVRTATVKVGVATIQSWVDDRMSASVLVDYFTKCKVNDPPPVVYPVSVGVRQYQICTKLSDYEPNAKSIMVPYMSPIYPNTFVPAAIKSSEQAAVQGRITGPSEDSKSLLAVMPPPSKFVIQCMSEFVDLLVPVKHAAHPVEVDDVYERQPRPSQRRLLEEGDSVGLWAKSIAYLKTFLKAEPYQKISDPRIITTYDSVSKREYSRYMYSFTELLCRAQWYSFGKNPLEIAQFVAELCSIARMVSCADANRMDGHVSQIVRDLELMILTAYFAVEHHAEVTELHDRQFNRKAVTSSGIKYMLDTQRGSGSSETAAMNTVLTKFMDFCARRLCSISPVDAYQAVGMFGGDDSIAADIDTASIVTAGAMVGQRIENVEFVRGEPGVNFLSRFFTQDVWNGCVDSTCDLPRALGKLHVTPSMTTFKPIQKLQQKLSGLSRTDAETPVIKEILTAARRVGMDLGLQYDKKAVGWWAGFDRDVNWPNAEPLDINEFLKCCGTCDIGRLRDYLSDCKSPEDLLSMPAIKSIDELPVLPRDKIVVVDQVVVPAVAQKVVEMPRFGFKLEPVQVAFGVKYPNMLKKSLVAPRAKGGHAPHCKGFWETGRCSYGAKCKFAHVAQPSRVK